MARPVDALAIVSWNIHEGAGDVDDLIRRLRRGEFTAGEPVEQFVLLLQEGTRRDDGVPSQVPRGDPVPRRIEGPPGSHDGDIAQLIDQGFAVFYAPSMRNGDTGEDRGNAIVSTLPLTKPAAIELPLERQRRVVITAAVEGSTSSGRPWHLSLVDVHLDTALALRHGGPLASRRRQAAALIEGLRTLPGLRNHAGAAVIGGDLNTWLGDREAAVKLLQGEFPDAAPVSAPTWTGPLGLRAELDHIFSRGTRAATPVTRLPSRFGSDHYPILAVVHFPSDPGVPFSPGSISVRTLRVPRDTKAR